MQIKYVLFQIFVFNCLDTDAPNGMPSVGLKFSVLLLADVLPAKSLSSNETTCVAAGGTDSESKEVDDQQL